MEIKQTELDMIEKSRRQIHEIIDKRFDELVQQLSGGEQIYDSAGRIEKTYSLNIADMLCKGKKPAAVIFPDGSEIAVKTWRQTAQVLLQKCNDDHAMHPELMAISRITNGRIRAILSSTGEGMDWPMMIDEGLYFESKFDTESMLRVIKQRIFDVVGYDYDGIQLRVYDPKLESADLPAFERDNEPFPEKESAAPGMTMD